ncbi:extensin family protein [Persicimonas caeni]|uniref:Extensin family protein n=1 Tax=Persicimonas caeni TaxID=2292766 RepID=A0A4Y6PML0_PERCE|nr:extensin family protein [Persicimonas caeni]QDG49521.1 extensin family protein [Persicimonas caeni]QED30742.1 extensin family protein [Persicimonas caeni]
MRARTIVLWGIILAGTAGLAGAAYVWKSWPRTDLVVEQGSQAVRDVGRSRSPDQLGRSAKRWWRKLRRQVDRDPYPLDTRSRVAVEVPGRGLKCPDVELVTYRGDTLGYTRPVQINRHFKPHLQRFEKIAARVGREVYGRPPSRIIHFGTYNCRTIRTRKFILSEHAFGNAIDVAGFEFDALPDRKQDLGRAADEFEVSVLFHWKLGRGFNRKHAVFLRSLAQELQRDRVFRGALVPPAPGHDDHFHLDMGWWVYFNGDPSFEES